MSYDVSSADDGPGTHVLRVLAPTNPAPGVPHNFLYVLPVEPELGTTYGDGLETLRGMDAQDQYNLTIIEPSFAIDPWYADNPNDPNLHYETFLTKDLVPWVTQNLEPPAGSQPFAALPGREQNWLIGFSKSGLGAARSPPEIPGRLRGRRVLGLPGGHGHLRPVRAELRECVRDRCQLPGELPFDARVRGRSQDAFPGREPDVDRRVQDFQTDVADYDALLTSEGILHTTETPQPMPHRWDGGWVPVALSALSQDGAGLAATP